MLQTYWLATAGFAGVLTLAWLFARRRITTTAGLSAAMWSIAALTSQDVEKLTQTGERVEAAVSPSLQYVLAGLALLSLLVLVLYRFGEYPPEDLNNE